MTVRQLAIAVAVVVATVVATVVAGAARAEAHDDVGVIAVVAADPGGPLSRTYEVDVTFANDGHGATDATVTVVAERAGRTVGPTAMDAVGQPGRYRATVAFPEPGSWMLRFSSLTPLATTERAEELADPGTANPSGSLPQSTSTTAPPPSTTASGVASPTPTPTTGSTASPATASTVAAGGAGGEAAAGGDGDSGGGAPVGLVVAGALAAVAAVGVGAWAATRRRAGLR
jgi:hypothetical protein